MKEPDLQYRGKNAKPIPPDYEPGGTGPSEWWYEFWHKVRLRDAKGCTKYGPSFSMNTPEKSG